MQPESVPSAFRTQIRTALIIFLLLTLVTGLLYPLLVTGIAQVTFHGKANGDLIIHNGSIAGSALIGQPFSSPGYFWGRPSATTSYPYNPEPSAGSNIGPTNPELINAVSARVTALRAADPGNYLAVPVDLVTTSASGLDPDISIAAARYQVSRVAKARNISETDIAWLIDQNTQRPQYWLFGEARVNVLSLNLALDDLASHRIFVPVEKERVPDQEIATPFPGISEQDIFQLALYGVVLILLLVPFGRFMARVYTGEHTILTPVTAPVEAWVYRVIGTRPDEEMDWRSFAVALLVFNLTGIIVVFLVQQVQHLLPLNPAGLGPVPLDLSLNTAVSFATNTNWQAYAGETTLSYLTQMIALTVQNFVSAATGMAVLIALIYGLSRKSTEKIGNFWVLLTRGIIILLPVCIIISVILVSQGSVQTFSGPVTVPLLDPVKDSNGVLVTTQTIPLGPAASQVAIKVLGTNGGGFFNTNSAHPFENPTPFSNFIEILAILVIPVCLCYTYGRMVGSARKGIAVLIAMTIIFVPLLGLAIWSETGGNPAFTPLGVDQTGGALQPGGNMEGKEVRFGVPFASMFSIVTTATSCGAVNSMHDSFMPMGGFAQMLMMQFGEVVYGGVGSGLYGMLVFIIIAMFIAGLMVGRTPEYLGKRIEPYEMKIATIIIIIPIVLILTGTAIAALTEVGKAGVLNPGAHGFSEILYAVTSVSQNNGSAFAGLSVNSLFYNLITAIMMVTGRYLPAILTLALAGAFAMKKIVPVSEGTLHDHRPLFIIWLVFVIVIVGALSFLPVLALGPVAEYLQIVSGGLFHV
ncbi:MAG: potassium-transporting ATPase subunit KdpA [Methanoregulaceae archaeon]|nr:potassium-transporting ATPase subunit KdpA [Methanoregulaceae archaeon]